MIVEKIIDERRPQNEFFVQGDGKLHQRAYLAALKGNSIVKKLRRHGYGSMGYGKFIGFIGHSGYSGVSGYSGRFIGAYYEHVK